MVLIGDFLHFELINWCRVAISAWLGLRLGTLLTWDQPPLYYHQPSYPLIIFQTVSSFQMNSFNPLQYELCDQMLSNLLRLFASPTEKFSCHPSVCSCWVRVCNVPQLLFHPGAHIFFTSNFMRPWVSTSLRFCPAVLNIIAYFTRLLLLRIENFSKSQ